MDSKKRSAREAGSIRKAEYFEKKTDNLLMLIRNAISRGIRFNYLLQYNILSLAKRLLDYQSLGELFKHAGVETLELTIVEKIWGYLLELLKLIADIFDIDMEQILDKIADDNQSITKIIKMNAALNAA